MYMLLWPHTQPLHLAFTTCSMGKSAEWGPGNEANAVLCSLMTGLTHTRCTHGSRSWAAPRQGNMLLLSWVGSERCYPTWRPCSGTPLAPWLPSCRRLWWSILSSTLRHSPYVIQAEGWGRRDNHLCATLAPSPFLFPVFDHLVFHVIKLLIWNWPIYNLSFRTSDWQDSPDLSQKLEGVLEGLGMTLQAACANNFMYSHLSGP